MLANIARFGMGFANVFSLPLMFSVLLADSYTRQFRELLCQHQAPSHDMCLEMEGVLSVCQSYWW